MTGPVNYRRSGQTFRPPNSPNLDYLEIVGDVEWHQDGTVTVTPRSRKMELMLAGMRAYWDRTHDERKSA